MTTAPEQEPVPVMPTALAKVAKEWGIFAAMCSFFIWWSYAREAALGRRYDALDEFVRSKLVTTVESNTKVLERVLASLERKQP
jgi:hypothetical protein